MGAQTFGYDRLILATGAVPVRPPITGIDELDADAGLFVLHSMGDAIAIGRRLDHSDTAVIVGGGYIGLEMAEALTRRGLRVTLLEALPQLTSTVDAELAGEVQNTLARHGVRIHTSTAVTAVARDRDGLVVYAGADSWQAGSVLVVTGVRLDTALAEAAGLRLGVRGSIAVDRSMRTSIADVYAAGDCAHTYHRLLDQHV